MNHKKSKFPVSAALFLASALPILAQDAADPYKKEAPAASNSQSAKQAPQVSLHLNTFSLSTNEAFALLNEFPSDKGRYDQLVKLAGQGKAKIERLIVLRTKSGQRAIIESINEIRYPIRTTGTAPAEKPDLKVNAPIPTRSVAFGGFETRNVGDTLEAEPLVSADSTIVDINLVPQTVLYLGDRDMPGQPGLQQPQFATQKTSTTARVHVGSPFLLSTPSVVSPTDAVEQRIWLQFITAYVVDATGTAVNETHQTTTPAVH